MSNRKNSIELDLAKKSKSFAGAPPSKLSSPALRAMIGGPNQRLSSSFSTFSSEKVLSPNIDSAPSSPSAASTPEKDGAFSLVGGEMSPSPESSPDVSCGSSKFYSLPSSPLARKAGHATYTTDELDSVKNYLSKKHSKDDSRGLFRMSKALKWYLFYVCLICGGLYLLFVHPNITKVLVTMNTWIVIVVLALNYGLTFISYLLVSWPAAKKGPVKANGDSVLITFERALVFLNIAIVTIDVFSTVEFSSDMSVLTAFLTRVILNVPHIVTCMIGFPRRGTANGVSKARGAYQFLGFVCRVIAQIGSTVAVLLCIALFSGVNSWIIGIVLPMVPFTVFMFFYARARIYNKIFPKNKKHKFIIFGDVAIREVMLFVIVLSVAIWVGGFVALRIVLASDVSPVFQQFLTQAGAASELSLLTFIWLCTIVSLTVFGIPAMYQSLLDYPTKRIVPKKYRLGKKTTFKKFLVFFNLSADDEEEDESTEEFTPHIAAERQITQNPLHSELSLSSVALRHDYMNDVSLIIACHMSENNIRPTLNAAIAAKFANHNIFVAHNGGSLAPPDKTGRVIRDTPAYKGVNYVYLPEGNKSIAMYWVIKHCIKTKYVMMIDDDVMLPANVDIEGAYHDLELKPEMKAVAFTIRGIDSSNLWQVFQHIEYMQSGYNKLFQAQFGSVLSCHGAIALWRTETAHEVFLMHNGEFHGEDLQMGLILRRMNKNFTIGANGVEPVPTTAPKSLFYEPVKNEKSLFVQRIFSWDMAAHHFLGDFLEIMFVNWERPSLILKPFLLLELWTQFQDWLRFILMISLLQADPMHFLFLISFLVLIQICTIVVFDRVILSNRPDVQASLWILMLYPVYNVILVGFRFAGLLVNMFYYTPWNPPAIPLSDRQDRGEIPPAIIMEKDIPVELQEYYWDNVWTNPSPTYKRCAVKVKRSSPLKEEVFPAKSTFALDGASIEGQLDVSFSTAQQQQLSNIFRQQFTQIFEKQQQENNKAQEKINYMENVIYQLKEKFDQNPASMYNSAMPYPPMYAPQHSSSSGMKSSAHMVRQLSANHLYQSGAHPPVYPARTQKPLSASFSLYSPEQKKKGILTDEDLASALSKLSPVY